MVPYLFVTPGGTVLSTCCFFPQLLWERALDQSHSPEEMSDPEVMEALRSVRDSDGVLSAN